MHMEVRALFGRFVWGGVNIDDVTIHPSRGSRINSTLKVCEHNLVAHALLVLMQMFPYLEGFGVQLVRWSMRSLGFYLAADSPKILQTMV